MKYIIQIGSDMAQSKLQEDGRQLLNVKMMVEDQSGQMVTEIVEQIDLTNCFEERQNRSIVLKKLILLLKNQYNFPCESTFGLELDKEVYFYLNIGQLFINCGIDPLSDDIKIRPEDYLYESYITIKIKDLGISMVHRLMSFENTLSTNMEEKQINTININERSKCRRTKQRRIGHIIDKVIQWRKYYSGTTNQQKQQIKYSLEQAAKEVKISKKSLDDYLFQIRFGHRYGFNFNEHYNDKVGVLRDFVRQRKKNDKHENKHRKVGNKNNEQKSYHQ